jgi:hypothetical protein
MNELIIVKSIFIFVVIWGLGILMLWFRPRIEIFWKIAATLVFAFYAWFFWDTINEGIDLFLSGWYIFLITFFKELLSLVFVNLFFIWPLALVILFYKADDIGAERLLKSLTIITLVLWILFILYFFFSSNIDSFLVERLKEMVPGAKQ